ncbi:FG-GAP-like repeat-containing protein [Winogradskyella tangerina]|uniref:FG-GAP-like repeat-containing protein n=1 Tax=Winogradskyella tangerina TaxID=2023240 RepID=UPI000DBE5E7E|nr:FG-GAP-like repeat-containing protein [Winogradskyella tangerina]
MKKLGFVNIIILLLVFHSESYSQIDYVDRATVLGITSHTGFSSFGGTGVSFADFDNDGFDDITLASSVNEPVRFYKNIDGFFFVEVDFFSNPLAYNYQTRSVTWIDYDNDGDKDLFLTSDSDGNRLFERQNNNLDDVTVASGFPLDNLFTYGASWGDINNDGCIDVYLSNRIGNTTITNYLFQNNCDGTFSEVTDSIGLTNQPALSFCSGFFDINNDGWQDLYVANDKFKPNYLYKNNGDGTFTDISESSGADIVIDAMSVTVDDFNADGFFDIYITNTPATISTPDPGCVLLKNNGDDTFTNISSTSGTDLDSFAWGSNFLDADNDSHLDLYVNTMYTDSDSYPSYAFYESNGDETFDGSGYSGFSTNSYRSYSSAIGDYNNDGHLEIIVNNDLDTNPCLWENIAVNTRNYISVALEGNVSNKDGIGSLIEISINGNKQYRLIMSGEGYLSQNSYTEHFGVDVANTIDYVKVKWLSGIEDTIFNVTPNQKITIVEGSTLSLDDHSNEFALQYFPNPCKTKLSFNSNSTIKVITILDELGRKISRTEFDQNEVTLDISSYSNGIYFAQVEADNFRKKSVKFIKE